MDGLPDARIGSAAAEVAAHGGVDVSVGGMRGVGQESGGRHDLAGLTVAALRHVEGFPGGLHGMKPVGRKAFNSGDGLAGHRADMGHAGANGMAVSEYRTCAAYAHAAAVLGAFEVKYVAEDPQEGHVRRHVHRSDYVVDRQFQRHLFAPQPACRKAPLPKTKSGLEWSLSHFRSGVPEESRSEE